MRLLPLFTEMPYAAALKGGLLDKRCSTCFTQPAEMRCPNGCETVVYCNAKCVDADRRNHKFECIGFKQCGLSKIDKFSRLLGRLLTRQLIDHGVVHLCENFPSNIPDRCLDDLMSHQKDIEKSKRRLKEMNEAMDQFQQFYADTPLVDDMDMARRMYCVMWINCFSISGPVNLEKGYDSSLGLGFYLNVSRFNHSCAPQLHVDFDGCRLAVLFPSDGLDETGAAEERASITESAEKLNEMTINYGYSTSFSMDGFFPLRSQRRGSLKFVYYFRCECELCDDEVEAELEENAAAIECIECRKPYVWRKCAPESVKCWPMSTKIKVTCVKSCGCPESADECKQVKKIMKKLNARETLLELEKEWKEATSFRLKDRYANEIIDACEPVRSKAASLWHPSANLRYAHLNERTFVSYRVMVTNAQEHKIPIDLNYLKMGLKTGEFLLSWCNGRPFNMYSTAMAAYALDLAQLYETAASFMDTTKSATQMWDRAAHWYQYAASVWAVYEKHTVQFVEQLNDFAAMAKKMSCAAGSSQTSMEMVQQ